ncbi:uncharacterized protein LOC120636861 [Pararge aegeria]|uniref:uncharacterized protein LOC120636861 n=1 Tax=Pararge aegeria TaxID=116150 RepID=UPI0019CF9D03|nr:uncharacterized protein LOC120636861 [Pararge aegeria]
MSSDAKKSRSKGRRTRSPSSNKQLEEILKKLQVLEERSLAYAVPRAAAGTSAGTDSRHASMTSVEPSRALVPNSPPRASPSSERTELNHAVSIPNTPRTAAAPATLLSHPLLPAQAPTPAETGREIAAAPQLVQSDMKSAAERLLDAISSLPVLMMK